MGKIYIISGDDDFARKQRARETAAMLTGCDTPENADCIEIIPCDLPELKPDDMAVRFIDSVRTPPFLSPLKVVWMRHHPDLEYFASGKNNAAVIAELLSEPLPEEISVLIDGPGMDKRKSVFKNWIKNGALAETFSVAKSSDRNFAENRRNVLAEFARSSGKRIKADAMQYLTEVIGGDSGTLASELEKLACYTGSAPEITIDDCRAIVSRTPEAMTWEYTDAVQRGDTANALNCLTVLFAQGEPKVELAIISALAKSFQKCLNIRMAMSELNISRATPSTFDRIEDALLEQYPANPLLFDAQKKRIHPFRAFKMCETASRISGAKIAVDLTLIRDTSRALVSSGGSPRILMEQLTIKLCR